MPDEYHVFNCIVKIKATEDAWVVEEYFKHLRKTFGDVIQLSAWAFDTPEAKCNFVYVEDNE